MMGRKVDTHQAAERAGVTVQTVRRWVEAGVLPARRTLGGPSGRGFYRIDVDDLDRLMGREQQRANGRQRAGTIKRY